MVRDGACEPAEAVVAAAVAGAAAAAAARARSAEGTAARSDGLSPARRRLAIGSSSDAARAATQTACRCDAGPCRMRRQASAATAAMRGTCHTALSRNVRMNRLIVSMKFLLPRFLQQLLNLR